MDKDSDLSSVPQSSQMPKPIDPQASEFVFNLVKKNQDRSGVIRENGGQCSTAYDSGSLDGSPYYAFYTYADTSSNTGSYGQVLLKTALFVFFFRYHGDRVRFFRF